MLSVGDVLAISVIIKFLIASVFALLEEYKVVKHERIEASLLVFTTAIVAVVLKIILNLNMDAMFNIFFYTLGVDNVSNYAKVGIKQTLNGVIHKKNNGD